MVWFAPTHELVAFKVIEAVGSGSMTIVCVPVAVHPFASVAFHVQTPDAPAVTVAPVVTVLDGEVQV